MSIINFKIILHFFQPLQIFTAATVANTLLLTVDRYVAVVHPLKYSGCWLTRHRTLYATFGIAWLLCISWAVVPVILTSLGVFPEHNPADYLWHSYTMVYGFYGVPMTLILVMNVRVIMTIYQAEPSKTGQVSPCANERVSPHRRQCNQIGLD